MNNKNDEDALTEGSIIAKRFKILKKLGEGGCGSVFQVEDLEQKGQNHAMKIESNSSQVASILKMEVHILQQMENKQHVAKLIASGKRPTFCYMVMTLLGRSLCSLIDKHGPYLNVSTQVRIGICLLFGIKQIHDVGYIHRDLKPANVALGYKGSVDERFFMILDFGLARQYVSDNGNGNVAIKKPRDRTFFRGTARYCSLAMHDRNDQGRVDDLWAIIYMLAELRHKLPWTDIFEKVEIAEMKRRIPDDVLLSKSPIQMLEVAAYIRTLNYYDRPEYDKIFKIFEDIMKQGNYKWSDPYHWEKAADIKKKCAMKKSKTGNYSSEDSKRNKRGPSGSFSPSARSKRKPVQQKKEEEEEKDEPFLNLENFLGNPLGF